MSRSRKSAPSKNRPQRISSAPGLDPNYLEHLPHEINEFLEGTNALAFGEVVRKVSPKARAFSAQNKVKLTEYTVQDLQRLYQFTEIRSLTLSNSQLNVPPEEYIALFQKLHKLRELEIDLKEDMLIHVDFVNALPRTLVTLKLHQFNFGNNVSFPALEKLTTLHLINCNMSSFTLNSLATCTNITELDITGIGIGRVEEDGDRKDEILPFAFMKSLPNLIKLVLVDANAQVLFKPNLAILGQLVSLEQLILTDVSDYKLTDEDIKAIAKSTSITNLDISSNPFTEVRLGYIGRMQQLISLNLAATKLTTLEPLSTLINLQELNISNNSSLTSDKAQVITNFKQLAVLKANDCSLDYWFMLSLSKLSSLVELDISHNYWTVAKGFKFLPASLTKLVAQYCRINDVQLAALCSRCAKLEYLDISGQVNDYSDVGLQYIAKLKRLTLLSLDQSLYITSYGLKFLVKLPKLAELYLENCYITDRALVYLSKFPALTSLSVVECPLTPEQVDIFKQNHPDIKVYYGDYVKWKTDRVYSSQRHEEIKDLSQEQIQKFYARKAENGEAYWQQEQEKRKVIITEAVTMFLAEQEELEANKEQQNWDDNIELFSEEEKAAQEEIPPNNDANAIQDEIFVIVDEYYAETDKIERQREDAINVLALRLERTQKEKSRRKKKQELRKVLALETVTEPRTRAKSRETLALEQEIQREERARKREKEEDRVVAEARRRRQLKRFEEAEL